MTEQKRKLRWELSGAGALLFALAYFLDNHGLIAALLPAAAVHELGHVLVLWLCRASIRRVRVGAFGVELDYSGPLEPSELLLAAAAGPAAGLIFALTAKRLGGEYLQFSGTISLWLSLFNLLPVLPLDGGRILELLAGEKIARAVSLTGAVLFLVDGIVLLALYRVPAPATVGLWLLLCQFRNAKNKIL